MTGANLGRMNLQTDIATLDRLPNLVTDLRAIREATRSLQEIEYAGADTLANDLDNALEALDGPLAALQYLEGIRYAKGDQATYRQWDAALAARCNAGEFA